MLVCWVVGTLCFWWKSYRRRGCSECCLWHPISMGYLQILKLLRDWAKHKMLMAISYINDNYIWNYGLKISEVHVINIFPHYFRMEAFSLRTTGIVIMEIENCINNNVLRHQYKVIIWIWGFKVIKPSRQEASIPHKGIHCEDLVIT